MIGQLLRGQASRNSKRSYIIAITSTVVMLVIGQVASAQYNSDFEDPLYTGSAAGTIITGQDAFYIPEVDGLFESQDGLVYTYEDNALGIPQNPRGGCQFAGVSGGDVALPQPFARAQRDIPYDAGGGGNSNCCVDHGGLGCDDQACQDIVCHADAFCCETEWDDICAGLAADLCGDLCGVSGVWTVTFDIAATFLGKLPSAQNIGSFSTQAFPEAATFIALATWTDPLTAANWNADYVWYDAAGIQLDPEQVPDPAFQNLQIDHWYRWSTTFDLGTNQITQVVLTDITTNATVTYNPPDRYLVGGSAGGFPDPSGFRLFGGTNAVGAEGNTLAFDNVNIALEKSPESPGPCLWDLDDSGTVGTNDLLLLFAVWGQTCVPADFDGGGVSTSDLLILFANWGPCP